MGLVMKTGQNDEKIEFKNEAGSWSIRVEGKHDDKFSNPILVKGWTDELTFSKRSSGQMIVSFQRENGDEYETSFEHLISKAKWDEE